MTKIIYILLCHQDPNSIIAQAEMLASQGDYVVIHFDRGAKASDFAALRSAFDGHPQITLVDVRVKCGWGEWSLVQATLNAIETGLAAFPDGAYFYMVSGDCMPIKSAAALKHYLAENPYDFIENVDFFKSYWIKTGMRQDRLIYRHWFNERARKPLFYASLNIQRFLRMKRGLPPNLTIKIGSQWWCLRRETVAAVLEFSKKQRRITRFFKTTWIPDETYFQTVVSHLIPSTQIQNRTLTFLTFTDHGMPATFYNDHLDFLISQDAFFARKISKFAGELRNGLREEFKQPKKIYETDKNGLAAFRHIRTAGRTGGRDGATFWSQGQFLGTGKSILIISCTNTDNAAVLRQNLERILDYPILGFVFGQDRDEIPEISRYFPQSNLTSQDAVQMARLLFDYFRSETILCFLDPVQLDVLLEIAQGQNDLRILHLGNDADVDALFSFAAERGVVGPSTPANLTKDVIATFLTASNIAQRELRASATVKYYDAPPKSGGDYQAIQLANFANITIDQANSVLGSTLNSKD